MAQLFGYFTCFITGLAVLILELIAFRLLAPYFGTSSYVVGAIINCILLALAVGYLVGGYCVDRIKSYRIPYVVILVCALYLTVIYFSYPVLLQHISEFSVIAGSFIAIVILFFIPMVLLAFVPPYLIKLLLVESRVGAASGLIFSISTLGSIVGGLLTTFYFIPYLGSQLSMLISIVMLYVLAATGLGRARRSHFAVILLALLPFLFTPSTPGITPLHRSESEYNIITVAQAYDRNLLLLNDNIGIQSVSLDPETQLAEHFYTDYFLFPNMLLDIRDTLILGNAAGTTMTSLAHYFPGLIEGVEIDPAVTRVGEQFFDLDLADENLSVVHEDGRLFLNRNRKTYDAVIIDMYGGGPFIPFHVTTVEFFEKVKSALKENGVMAINLPFFAGDTMLEHYYLATIGREFRSAFRFGQVLYAFRQNISLPEIKALAIQSDRPENLQKLADKILAGLQPVRLPAQSDKVFTDDHAAVEQLTFQAISSDWLTRERQLRKERIGY